MKINTIALNRILANATILKENDQLHDDVQRAIISNIRHEAGALVNDARAAEPVVSVTPASELRRPASQKRETVPLKKWPSVKGVLLVDRAHIALAARNFIEKITNKDCKFIHIAEHIEKHYPHFFQKGATAQQIRKVINNGVTASRMRKLARLKIDWQHFYSVTGPLGVKGLAAAKTFVPYTPTNILDRPFDDLGLPTRAYNAIFQELGREGTVRQLTTLTEAQLLRLNNFGRKSLTDVKMILMEHGLHLGMGRGEARPVER